MHKVFYILSLALMMNTALFAQSSERSISVVGTAEYSLPPNNMELLVTLSEYNSKSLESGLEWIQSKLTNLLSSSGVYSNQISKHNCELVPGQSKEVIYKIILKNETQINAVLKGLNFRGITALEIISLSNSNIAAYKKQVQQEALKNAHTTATNILESIDKKLGDLISIDEIPIDPVSTNNLYEDLNLKEEYPSINPFLLETPTIDLFYSILVRYAIE